MTEKQNFLYKDFILGNSQKGKNLIAVCSGAYGSGKTWLSLALAHAFSLKKQKILFFDGDWGSTNLSSFIEFAHTNDLKDAIYQNMTLNQITARTEKFGFDILPGNKLHAGLSSLPIGRLQLLSEDLLILSRFYNKVILDISSEKEKSSFILAGSARNILLIITPNPQTLTNGYDFIKLMNEQYPSCKISIVVNQVNTKREGEMIYNTMLETSTKFLNITPELLGVIRNDPRIRDCQKNQTLILSRYPNSDAAKDVLEIVEKLA